MSDDDWLRRELEELSELEDGPGPEDEAWLRELLPAVRDLGRDDEAEGPSPEVVLASVLREPGASAPGVAARRWLGLAAAVLVGALGLALALSSGRGPGLDATATAPPTERPRPTDPADEPTRPNVETADESTPADPGEEPTDPADDLTRPDVPADEPTRPDVPADEPTRPVDPADPADPADRPTRPDAPTDPADPAHDPTRPDVPADTPTNPADTDPADDPTDPADGPTPADPADDPTDPADGPTPADPADDPTDPANSADDPTRPDAPTDPADQPAPAEPVDEPETESHARPVELAQVQDAGRRARVQRDGSWEPLTAGATIYVGDTVDVGREPSQLALVRGGSLWLGPETRVACTEAYTLDSGSCVLRGGELPALFADGVEVSPVGEAELRVQVSRRTVDVDVYAGKVYVRDAQGDSADLAAGRGVRVRRGRLGDPRPAQLPPGLRQALAPKGQRVYAEAWDAQAKARYGLLLGELNPEGLRATKKPIAPVERAICVAGREGRGLCAAPAGGRLYLRIRLEERHPITLQLSSPDQSRSWRRTVEGHAGVNHVDLALDALPALGGGAEIQPGQLLDLLSLQAGGAGETIPLVLEYVQVYVPN